jgi:hypothetical protein
VQRDRRYDGRFFSGVRATRIYCRPVCLVRPAKGRNVTFYPSAGAAEAAGFRPCLRCRPGTAPFSPAWQGSRATVHRAVRLIHDGALDRGGLDALALRLGIGTRHLGRLFAKHIGASPLQVAGVSGAACQAPARPHAPADDRGRGARGLRELAPLQHRIRRGLPPPANRHRRQQKGPGEPGPCASLRSLTWASERTCRPSRYRCRRPGS